MKVSYGSPEIAKECEGVNVIVGRLPIEPIEVFVSRSWSGLGVKRELRESVDGDGWTPCGDAACECGRDGWSQQMERETRERLAREEWD